MTIFLLGFMGSGKSTLGKFAAKRNGLQFVDLDAWIEEKHGKSISEIFAEEGEEQFREYEREALREVIELGKSEDLLVSCGGGTPCFFENMQEMNRAGLTLYLKLPAGMLAHRLKNAKTQRPLLQEVEDLKVWIEEKLEMREKWYGQAKEVVEDKLLSRNAFSRWLGDRLAEQKVNPATDG